MVVEILSKVQQGLRTTINACLSTSVDIEGGKHIGQPRDTFDPYNL